MKIQKTYDFVKKAFEGITDKSGVPYIEHLVGVYLISATKYQLSEDYLHAALLHDLIEDTEYKMSDLESMGYNKITIGAVAYLTRLTSETNNDYIEKIRRQRDTSIIKLKLADIEHNMSLNRIIGMNFSLIDSYQKSWNILTFELISRGESK